MFTNPSDILNRVINSPASFAGYNAFYDCGITRVQNEDGTVTSLKSVIPTVSIIALKSLMAQPNLNPLWLPKFEKSIETIKGAAPEDLKRMATISTIYLKASQTSTLFNYFLQHRKISTDLVVDFLDSKTEKLNPSDKMVFLALLSQAKITSKVTVDFFNWTIRSNDTDSLDYLIKRGVRPNQRNIFLSNRDPLHFAETITEAQLLLGNGANQHLKNNMDETAFELARSMNKTEQDRVIETPSYL